MLAPDITIGSTNRVLETTLYTTHSTGQVGSWCIEVFDEQPVKTVVTATKVLGGKSVATETFTHVGKNIGRANETTPLVQAIDEAQSKARKKMDKGYTVEIPQVGQKATNSLGFLMPMLAQPIEKVKKWSFPVHVQPKMDGHRMLATVKDGQVVLYSRQGKVIDVEHIRSELQDALDNSVWNGDTLDGEIYAHGLSLQAIASLVKKPQEQSRELVYNLYDIDRKKPYSLRLEELQNIAQMLQESKCIALTDTWLVQGPNHLNELHAQYIGQGYEGTIVRQGDAPYEDGKRSMSLMKKKDFQDDEFEIIGVDEGKPNNRLQTRVGIYRCKTKDGKEFSVTSPGDAQEKDHHAVNGHANIGKHLTVKFFNYTPDGVPFHPVGLRIREDI